MKALLLLTSWWLFLPAYGQAQSQNLISNGDFEEHTNCPTYANEIDKAKGWYPINTPDLFDSCSPFEVAVPQNFAGNRQPASGSAYVGFFLFGGERKQMVRSGEVCRGCRNRYFYELTEGIWTKLNAALKKKQRYELLLSVSLSDTSLFYADSLYVILAESKPKLSIKGGAGRYSFSKAACRAIALPREIPGAPRTWHQVKLIFTAERGWKYVGFGLPRELFSRRQWKDALRHNFIKEMPPIRPAGQLYGKERYYAYYYLDAISLTKVAQ